MRLCINPDCNNKGWENPDTAIHCEQCGNHLLLDKRYIVQSVLSNKSGFGVVYTIADKDCHQKVLKVLRPKYNDEPRTVELFQQEVSLLQEIHTPGLPKIDAYIHHALPHGKSLHGIVMEKIAGDNLQDWMKARHNQPISQKRAIAWLREITSSLQVVHQKNYFHRDIKPSNIMLRPSGQLVLIDFGSARHESETYMDKLYGQGGITQISTMGYTAPEQQRGFAVPQSDFFALGMTFIHLVTGKHPLKMYDAHLNLYVWRPFAPQLSPALADLLDCMIAIPPIERPLDCSELLHCLDAVAGGTSTPITPAATSKPWIHSWIKRLYQKVWLRIVIASAMTYGVAAHFRFVPSPFTQPPLTRSQGWDCHQDELGSLMNCGQKIQLGIYASTPR